MECVCLQSLLSTYYCMSWQQDKWQPLLNTVASVQKYRWLKHSVQGAFSQSSLMATIVDFALKEEPLDVEKMRKCLLKQVGVGVWQCFKAEYIKQAEIWLILFPYSWRGLKWDWKALTPCWSWPLKASCCRLCSMQCSAAGKESYQKGPTLGRSPGSNPC